MQISIVDHYHDTLRTLGCFEKLKHHNVTVWTDHVQDVDPLANAIGGHRNGGPDQGAGRVEHCPVAQKRSTDAADGTHAGTPNTGDPVRPCANRCCKRILPTMVATLNVKESA
jgi:hypothetical protein